MSPASYESIDDYFARSHGRWLSELSAFLGFASISAPEGEREEIAGCAAWLVEHLTQIGFENAREVSTAGNPIVYSDWLHAPAGAPTALVYGHYDVQPPGPLDRWHTNPFSAACRDGRLYARGASDNKGNLFLHLKALEALLATQGALPCNVRIVVEGDEERSQEPLEQFMSSNSALLAADVLVNTDAAMYDSRAPGISVGLRGFVATELNIRTAAEDLHSGLYGGVAANAIHVAAALIESFHGEHGEVVVAGFYDSVRPVDPAEAAAWRHLPFDETWLKEAGVGHVIGEEGHSHLERLWVRPTLDVNGLTGGFTGEGVLAIIPSSATIKLSCRLVEDQDPDEILGLLRDHVTRHLASYADGEVTYELSGGAAVSTSAEHPAIRAGLEALEAAFDGDVHLYRSGWSVPVVEIAQRLYGLESVQLGFGLPADQIHAANESIDLAQFDRGLKTMAVFWPKLRAATARSPAEL